jgi:putative membrane protein
MLMGGMGIIWILIFVGIVFLFRENFQRRREDKVEGHAGALEVLKVRYAKGDIDKNEFERKRKDLLQ